MEGRGVSVQFCLHVLPGLGDSIWRGNWRILLSRADPLPGADIMVIRQLPENWSCRELFGDKKEGCRGGSGNGRPTETQTSPVAEAVNFFHRGTHCALRTHPCWASGPSTGLRTGDWIVLPPPSSSGLVGPRARTTHRIAFFNLELLDNFWPCSYFFFTALYLIIRTCSTHHVVIITGAQSDQRLIR